MLILSHLHFTFLLYFPLHNIETFELIRIFKKSYKTYQEMLYTCFTSKAQYLNFEHTDHPFDHPVDRHMTMMTKTWS